MINKTIEESKNKTIDKLKNKASNIKNRAVENNTKNDFSIDTIEDEERETTRMRKRDLK